MFTPDPDAYLIFTTKGELFGNGLTQSFYNALLRHSLYGFKHVCIGCNDAFVLCTKDHKVTYLGLPEQFVPAWKSGEVLQV